MSCARPGLSRIAILVVMETAIRRYRHADEDAVVEVWALAARVAHPFVEGEGAGERELQMREVYLVQAENWVAETPDGQVVGLLGLLGSEIGGLFVHPSAQGFGIGRALVEHALSLHEAVTLDVYELNETARGFYAAMGFTEQSRHPEPSTGHTLVSLRL